MKTARDIKMSLDVAGAKRAPCRTTQIEEQIKNNLLTSHGDLLTTAKMEKIVQKEEKRIRNQDRAIRKARMNILRQKERIKIIQAVRKRNYTKPESSLPPATSKKAAGMTGRIHAIDVGY